jgi:hypothetical protein
MSISSLGGPLKAEYLTLPRTKIRDSMSFATGGYIPEVAGATDEEIMAMVQRGELDPNMANKIIMERASRDSRSASTEAPTSETLGKMVPQVVKDWWNATPSKPFDTPQGQAMRQGIGQAIGINGRPQTPPEAPPPPPVATEPVFTPQQNATVDAMQRQGGRPIDVEPPSGAEGWKSAPSDDPRWKGGVAEKAGAWLGLPNLGSTPRPHNDPNALTPALEPPAGGISALPAAPKGAASPQAGGIVPEQDPMAPEAYGPASQQPPSPYDDPNALTPALTPPDPQTTGGVGEPNRKYPDGIDPEVRRMAETPMGQQAVAGTDQLFGAGRGWEALMMLGLGMAASKNTSPLGALAEGGLGAMKYMGDRRKEDRDERRLSQNDRRLDNAETRANNAETRAEEAARLGRDRFNLEVRKDARDAPLAAEDRASQIAYRKSMTEYYNSGGKSNSNRFTPAEKVTQARQILHEAETHAQKAADDSMKAIENQIADPTARVAERQRIYEQAKQQWFKYNGYNPEGFRKIYTDAYGDNNIIAPVQPSTNPAGGFSIKSINGKPYSPK